MYKADQFCVSPLSEQSQLVVYVLQLNFAFHRIELFSFLMHKLHKISGALNEDITNTLFHEKV